MPNHCRYIVAAALLPVLAAAARAEATAAPKPRPAGQQITVVLAGDTGFSPNHAAVNPRGVTYRGRFQTWSQATSGIARSIDGEFNFLNVETVVTENNALARDLKGQRSPFSFRTHPNGILHLVGLGFNVLSLANNHSMDYGVAGLRDTLRHTRAMKPFGLKAAAGIGLDRDEASTPQRVDINGAAIAFSAIGIVTNNLERHRAGPGKPGQIAYRFDDDFDLATGRLTRTSADFRILSIHYGLDRQVRADARQFRDWRRDAALAKGIDLIVGHHAHVPRAVEIAGRSVIFYGLGNFLHHGTADMSNEGICKDFGLLAKVHLVRSTNGRLTPQAIEVIPLTEMHWRVAAMNATDARKRIHALNYLGVQLGGDGRLVRGVRFTPQRDGSGLYCFPAAGEAGGKVARLCRGWREAPAIPAALTTKITQSCAT